MSRLKQSTFSLLAAFFMSHVSAEPIIIKHYQLHERYTYGAQLLELALDKLDIPYDIQPASELAMNEARGEYEVIAGNLDLQWLSTSPKREKEMIAVKIPIYRGILGLRLLLIKNDRTEELGQIKSLADLQRYTGAHGKHWGDLPVYAANDLPVMTLVDYDKLFHLLKIGRADYFHRGINEIWGEHDKHSKDLTVADNVMLFYPLPVYFFVTKSRPDLAELIDTGLRKSLEDGSFKAHFLDYHESFIEAGNLDSRTLIELDNPNLPMGTPDLDTSWWLQNQ